MKTARSNGLAWRVSVRRGASAQSRRRVRQGRQGWSRRCPVWPVPAMPVQSRQCPAWQVRRGLAQRVPVGRGEARPGMAGSAWRGSAWPRAARPVQSPLAQGKAGVVRLSTSSHGSASLGKALFGSASPATGGRGNPAAIFLENDGE
jgi:hypothetical protein